MTSTSHQGNISEYVDVYKPQAHEGVDIAAERMKRKLNDDNIKGTCIQCMYIKSILISWGRKLL